MKVCKKILEMPLLVVWKLRFWGRHLALLICELSHVVSRILCVIDSRRIHHPMAIRRCLLCKPCNRVANPLATPRPIDAQAGQFSERGRHVERLWSEIVLAGFVKTTSTSPIQACEVQITTAQVFSMKGICAITVGTSEIKLRTNVNILSGNSILLNDIKPLMTVDAKQAWWDLESVESTGTSTYVQYLLLCLQPCTLPHPSGPHGYSAANANGKQNSLGPG